MICAVLNNWMPLLLSAILLSASALAQTDSSTQPQPPHVYKWKDPAGVLHYDDKSLTEPRLALDLLDTHRVAPAANDATPKAFVDEVARRCSLTREREQSYRSATALYGRDPFGNVYPMSPTQIGLATASLGRDESRYCGPDSARKLYLAAYKRTAGDAAK